MTIRFLQYPPISESLLDLALERFSSISYVTAVHLYMLDPAFEQHVTLLTYSFAIPDNALPTTLPQRVIRRDISRSCEVIDHKYSL